ncbi:MAG: thioesterase family protein [Maricaulaceae bacterium]|jgi:hypothetical protein
MAVFERDDEAGLWRPTLLARGPSGLQGGAVAGLMVGEIERRAAEEDLGFALSATAWFLKPTPMQPLRSEMTVIRQGGRAAIIDNALTPEGEDEPCALARVMLVRPRPIEAPPFDDGLSETPIDPTELPVRTFGMRFEGPWFAEAMEMRFGEMRSGETRTGEGVVWFKMNCDVVEGGGAMSQVVGPADWAHGIARPLPKLFMDPNPNLTVQLYRPLRGDWLGLEPSARWDRELGLGAGRATLRDVWGEVGSVSMAIALTRTPLAFGGRREAS